MTDLDRQAIRDYATNALSLGMYNAYFNMAAVVALLDALEAAERERDARTVERDTWRERWQEAAEMGLKILRASDSSALTDNPDAGYSATVEIRDGRVESIGYMEPER